MGSGADRVIYSLGLSHNAGLNALWIGTSVALKCQNVLFSLESAAGCNGGPTCVHFSYRQSITETVVVVTKIEANKVFNKPIFVKRKRE